MGRVSQIYGKSFGSKIRDSSIFLDQISSQPHFRIFGSCWCTCFLGFEELGVVWSLGIHPVLVNTVISLSRRVRNWSGGIIYYNKWHTQVKQVKPLWFRVHKPQKYRSIVSLSPRLGYNLNSTPRGLYRCWNKWVIRDGDIMSHDQMITSVWEHECSSMMIDWVLGWDVHLRFHPYFCFLRQGTLSNDLKQSTNLVLILALI